MIAAAPSLRSEPLPRVATRARRGRVLGGWIALLASLGAHALMAAVVGVTLRAVAGARPRPPAAGVESEINEVPAPIMIDAPAREIPSPAAPVPRVRSRHVASHAIAAPVHAASVAPAPLPVVTPDGRAPADQPGLAPVKFVMSAGTVAARAPARAALAGGGTSAGVADAEPVLDGAAVDERARFVSGPTAIYPPAARRAEVEGDVPLEIIVGPDGAVASARVLVSQGYGLDAAALQTVRAYRFTPARRAGRPVRVRMRWSVQFRLH